MGLGENIQFLRKEKAMTQEELADRMGVSRQTISKWESGGNYPEMDKLLLLCELFNCDLDTLVRNSAEQSRVSDSANYDAHQNRFTYSICTGVALVLFGVTLLLGLTGFGVNPSISTMIFMFFVVISVTVFIVSGISHSEFEKKHHQIIPFYKQKQVDAFNRKFPYLIAIPTALILMGVIWVIGASTFITPEHITEEAWGSLCTTPLMCMVTIAAPIYVYAGMQKSKYNVEEYNNEHAQTQENKRQEELVGRISGCIMLCASAAYLLMGFLGNLWHIGWVVFPIGGIACGIVSTALKKN